MMLFGLRFMAFGQRTLSRFHLASAQSWHFQVVDDSTFISFVAEIIFCVSTCAKACRSRIFLRHTVAHLRSECLFFRSFRGVIGNLLSIGSILGPRVPGIRVSRFLSWPASTITNEVFHLVCELFSILWPTRIQVGLWPSSYIRLYYCGH